MKDGGFNDKFDERLREAASQYNEPPETPRDAMWARIVAGRAEKRVPRTPAPAPRPFWHKPWAWVPVAAAAVLIVGIGIGRFTATDEPDRVVQQQAVESEPFERSFDESNRSGNRSAYQLAAAPVFNQAELLLTQYRTGEALEDNGDSYSSRAASLLMDTRLLLDSPAADDPKLRRLLSDLELVLTQLVRATAGDESVERELINESMNNRSLLPRLRANVPVGTFSSTI
jgi:hypothetical protein